MGTFYWMNEGEIDVIDIYLRNQTQNANLYMGLFTAPIEGSFDETKEYEDLTEVSEETDGYARQQLAPGDWVKTGSMAYQDYKQFDLGETVTVLGYFIMDTESGTGKLLAVEYFDDAIEIEDGEYLKVKPQITIS